MSRRTEYQINAHLDIAVSTILCALICSPFLLLMVMSDRYSSLRNDTSWSGTLVDLSCLLRKRYSPNAALTAFSRFK